MSAATSTLRRRTMPEVDHGAARGRVEARVGGRQAGLLERDHQLAQRLLVVDPAQELPDRPEVLDVVDQRGAGQRHHQRPVGALADLLGDLEDVLGALRRLVLDEVRLVDHHAAEAVLADPADVPVEHLVVDDHDVGEAVDRLAVAVDHGGGTTRGPQPDLARPVGLDDVGHDHEQRVGVGGLGREQRLGGLAETGLVGQQIGAVTGLGGGDELRLVAHQLETTGSLQRGGLGQLHAGGRAGGGGLEGAEERAEQLPADQPVGAGLGRLRGGEVGDEEGVGQLAGDDRLRDGATFGRRMGRGGLVLLRLLGLLGLEAAGQDHLPLQRLGGVGDDGVLGEQREERRVAGRGLGEDGRDAVEPLELLGALRLGRLGVGLDPGALVAHEQGDDLELGADTGHRGATLDGVLDLAHSACEHRDDALVVERTTPALSALGGTASA